MLAKLARQLGLRGRLAWWYVLLAVAAAAAIVLAVLHYRRRRRNETFMPFLAKVKAAAPKWVCPPGFAWSGSKVKGKECKKGSTFSGTVKAGGGGLGGIATAIAGVASKLTPGLSEGAPNSKNKSSWMCKKNGEIQGQVAIDWNHKTADGTWACNEWVKACGKQCKAERVIENETANYPVVYYADGRAFAVTDWPAKNPPPIDQGFNDKRAGGITKVYMPAKWTVCLKNRRDNDDIFSIIGADQAGLVGKEANYPLAERNGAPAPPGTEDTIDEIWGYSDGRNCPGESTFAADFGRAFLSTATLGMITI